MNYSSVKTVSHIIRYPRDGGDIKNPIITMSEQCQRSLGKGTFHAVLHDSASWPQSWNELAATEHRVRFRAEPSGWN